MENVTTAALTHNTSDADVESYGSCAETAVSYALLEIIISVVGLVFNGIAIFFILMFKDYKKSISHLYVLQLAISDIIFLGLLPLMAHEHLVGEWRFTKQLCLAFQGTLMMNYYAGILFLTVMSFDRYVAIVHPVSASWRKIRTHGNAVLIAVIVWITSFILSFPLWIFSDVQCKCDYSFPKGSILEEEGLSSGGEGSSDEIYNDDGDPFYVSPEDVSEAYTAGRLEGHLVGTWYRGCHDRSSLSFRVWLHVNFILTFVLPLVVMTICYSLLLWRVLHPAISSANTTLRRRRSSDSQNHKKKSCTLALIRSRSSSSSSSSSRCKSSSDARKQKVTGIVVTLVVTFVICWLPFHAVKLAKLTGMHFQPETCDTLTDVVALLAFSNGMLNPILYTFLGSDFCQRFCSYFRREKRASLVNRYTRSSRGATTFGRNSVAGSTKKTTDASLTSHVNTLLSTTTKHHQQSLLDKSHLLNLTLREADTGCDIRRPWITSEITDFRSHPE